MFALTQETKTKILAEEWSKAQKPKNIIPKEELTKKEPLENKPEKPKPALPPVFNKKITLRASGVSLKTVLSKISEVTGYNTVYDPEADMNVNIALSVQDVPVWRALNTMLFPLNYGFRLKDGDLVILSRETRTFKLSLPPGIQSFSDTISNESWTKPETVI